MTVCNDKLECLSLETLLQPSNKTPDYPLLRQSYKTFLPSLLSLTLWNNKLEHLSPAIKHQNIQTIHSFVSHIKVFYLHRCLWKDRLEHLSIATLKQPSQTIYSCISHIKLFTTLIMTLVNKTLDYPLLRQSFKTFLPSLSSLTLWNNKLEHLSPAIKHQTIQISTLASIV